MYSRATPPAVAVVQLAVFTQSGSWPVTETVAVTDPPATSEASTVIVEVP
jgi:hypothetical protein